MATLAWLFAFGPEARVFTIAPSFRQVDNNLWGELKGMVHRSKVPLGGRMFEGTEYKLGEGWFALGFSTKEPEMVHGIHGKNDLLIVDDGHGVPITLTSEVENMMAGGNTHVLWLYNPVALSGETYDCTHSKAHLYHNIQIAFKDTPNCNGEGRVVIPGMLTKEQADEWIKTYGWDSAFVRVKVRAEYPLQEADTLIPLDWVEAAFDRVAPAGIPVVGVDVARFGDDRSVAHPMLGRRGLAPIVTRKYDTMEVTGIAKIIADQIRTKVIAVDGIGIGAGVVDRLRELGYSAQDVVAGAKARDEEQFADVRSEMWWQVREALNPTNPAAISLFRDPELQAELTSVKYKIASDKRIRVESKDDMKKRLGYSPDKADALCLANYARAAGMRPTAALSTGSIFSVAKPEWA